jgi:uncharacterized membrane protein
MSTTQAIVLFFISLIIFLAIDLLWLGFVAKDLYAHFMGDILREKPNWAAALTFYAIFVAGLTYFVTAPAIDAGSLTDAAVRGALFGIVTYATFDLTSLAVLKGYPLGIVPIDMAWGAVLATSVSTASYTVYTKLIA